MKISFSRLRAPNSPQKKHLIHVNINKFEELYLLSDEFLKGMGFLSLTFTLWSEKKTKIHSIKNQNANYIISIVKLNFKEKSFSKYLFLSSIFA